MSHAPISIVTSRLSTAIWYAPTPERVEEQEEDHAVQQLADDLRALADEPVQPEELAELLRRREPDHQHPVGDLDAAEAAAEDRPGERNIARPDVPGDAQRDRRRRRARPPTTRARPSASASGPSRSTSAAPAEARDDRDDRQAEQDDLRRRSLRPIASVATTLITTMIVLTASE